MGERRLYFLGGGRQARVTMAETRVSQVAALVAATSLTEMRTSQISVETLCSTDPAEVRVSQIAIEVLCSPPVFEFEAYASTSIAVSGSSTRHATVNVPVSAYTSFAVSVSATGYAPADRVVLAVTGLGIAGSGGGEGRSPGNVERSAGHSLGLSGIAGVSVSRARSVSASTSLFLGSDCYSPSDRTVSATTSFIVSSQNVGKSSSIQVSALTSLLISSQCSETAVLSFIVAATTGIAISTKDQTVKRGPFLVSAATSFAMISSSTEVFRGPKLVAATTGILFADTGGMVANLLYYVSAATAISVTSKARESSDLGVSGFSSLGVLGSGSEGRDINVSASVSLGIGPVSKTTNLKTVGSLSELTWSVVALAGVSGTEARSSIAFLDLAQAVVWIPWRPSGLSLDPGGNLPHS